MDDASAWVTGSCADLGLVVLTTGERIHDRPWSDVVARDIREGNGNEGRVWFKASGIGTRHEPKLISALASLVPDLVPEVLAVDAERAWSLSRDAGPTWRSAVAVADQWPLWEDLLGRYAVAQLALAAHRAPLLAMGVPERSPATLPHQAAELIAELTLLGDGCGGLSAAEAEGLAARLPLYGHWCHDLDGAGIPLTIQHDDLHSNNICLAGPAKSLISDPTANRLPAVPEGRTRVIDWGDASIGHPFGTMLVTLRSIAHHGCCEVSDPRVQRVRDAYLEPFTAHAPRAELIAVADVAQRVGAVARALSWRAALLGTPTPVHGEYDFPVRRWIQELLADPRKP